MLKGQRGEVTILGLVIAALIIFGLLWGYNHFKNLQEAGELKQRLSVASTAHNWNEVMMLTGLLTQVSSDYVSNNERAWIYNERGRAFMIKTNYNEALACFKSSIQYDPTHYYAYYNQGIIYEEWHDSKNAKAMYKKYLELLGNKDDGEFSKHAKEYVD